MQVEEAYIARLNRARKERGWSVEELAVRTGFPADLVQPLLDGSPVFLSEDMNRELCEALSLDADEMWRHRREFDRSTKT